MNDMNSVLRRLVAIEDELVRLRKQRNYELNNLDETNIPRLREYSETISANKAAVTLVEQKVTDVESSVTILSQYTAMDNVVVVESSEDKSEWDTSRVYYDSVLKVYFYHDGTTWKETTNPVTAGLDTSIAKIEARTTKNESEISSVAKNVSTNASNIASVTQTANKNSSSISSLTQSVTTNANNIASVTQTANTNKSNITSLTTSVNKNTANIAAVTQTANANKSSISTLTASVNKNTTNIAAVTQTANSASASVSTIVANIGSDGTVNAASIVAKINEAGSSVQIAADHISLAGKTIALTSDGINIESTYFDVSTTGVVECSAMGISGDDSYIDIESSSTSLPKITVSYSGDLDQYSQITPHGFYSELSDSQNGIFSANQFGITDTDTGFISALPYQFTVYSAVLNKYAFQVNASQDGWDSQTIVNGSFAVTGAKSRVESTEHYGDRLMYAYETPAPMYADFGRGTIAEDGICMIYLDPLFYECVDNVYEYFVFLQRESGGDMEITERTPDHFSVTGTPGTSFAWMLTAPQNGYVMTRCEEHHAPEADPPQIVNPENAVYDAIADKTLNEYENQLG